MVDFRQLPALNIVHDKIGAPSRGNPAVDDMNDIGMVEPSNDSGLLLKKTLNLLIPQKLRRQELDRNRAIQRKLLRLINGCHPALTKAG